MRTAIALTLRVVLGVFWAWAGLTKLAGHFDAIAFLAASPVHSSAAPKIVHMALVGTIERVALPHIGVVNFVVPWTELAVGLALLIGVGTAWAVVAASAMSALFLMCGATSTNPLLLFGAVLLAMSHPHARTFSLLRLCSSSVAG
jgi:thiosulfate dehydrogenase (quinone) large subunit